VKDESTARYEIYRDDQAIVFLNLYPYQVGHLLVSPLRHIMGYEEFTPEEIQATSVLVQRCIQMLSHFGRTESFNIGWNQGNISGGSIKHNHIHVVPRYPNEMNFFEIIAKTKPIIQALEDTHKYLSQYEEFLAGKKSIEELNIKSAW
jgi:ATP adenylyltransferase